MTKNKEDGAIVKCPYCNVNMEVTGPVDYATLETGEIYIYQVFECPMCRCKAYL